MKIEESMNNTDEVMHVYYEMYGDRTWETFQDALNSLDGERQKWVPMKTSRLQKIWRDYSKLGIVRDVIGIISIEENFLKKIVQLDVNTMLLGHTQTEPLVEINECYETKYTEEDLVNSNFYEYFEDHNGQLRMSDYGIPKLHKQIINSMTTSKVEDKLLCLDMLLSVVHMRSDLAEMFVKGGRLALEQLSNDIDIN
jgi:hypothetical protein